MNSPSSITEVIKFLTPPSDTTAELRFRALLGFMAAGEDVRTALRTQLARSGLTIEGFLALAAIRSFEPGPSSPSALATVIGTSRALLSHTLTRLEFSNLISRERDLTDRRVIWLRLTPAGRTAIEQGLTTCNECVTKLVGEFDHADLTDLVDVCGKINTQAHQLV
jgi:DNA-binding MarR family transcriptional regulator